MNKPLFSAILSFIVLTAVFVSIITTNHYLNTKHNKKLIYIDNQHDTSQATASINTLKEVWLKDILQLEKNVVQFAENSASQQHFIRDVEKHFYNTAQVRPLFHQLRLLDISGHEIVRVEHKKQNVDIVKKDDLQDKGNRYYFQDMQAKAADEIYFSKFDLNVEHGKIEQPHRPIIRLGKSIELPNKQTVYIIINIEGKELLKGVTDSFNYPFQDVFFVNKSGFFLLNPEPHKNWGFMFNNQFTLADEDPLLWKAINANEVGDSSHVDERIHFQHVTFNDNNDSYYIISKLNKQGLETQLSSSQQNYHQSIIFILIINFFVGILVYQFNKAHQDYKQEKEQEKQRHQAMLMQNNRQAAMGEMVSAIAHQWRQPLNIMNGVMINLRDELSSDSIDKESINKQINIAITNSRYMSQTIDDFKHFFDTSDKSKEFDLILAIDQTQQIVNASIIDVNIEFDTNLIDDTLKLNGKQNELQQVIINLISNARDAYQQIQQVETPKIEVKLADDEAYAYIHISDYGIGISEELKQKIFEPNFTTKDKLNNSGLGLYLSKMIIEQNFKGHLLLNTNTPGKTVFTIKLPKIQIS